LRSHPEANNKIAKHNWNNQEHFEIIDKAGAWYESILLCYQDTAIAVSLQAKAIFLGRYYAIAVEET
jgi:hypothetical protein